MWGDDDFGTLRTFIIDEEEVTGEESPERDLLRAILRATLLDLQAGGTIARKARFYMVQPDESHLLAFNNLCRMLDLDPDVIRRLAGVAATERGQGT